jgi:hypothetical protein
MLVSTDYAEVRTQDLVHPLREYRGEKLLPQTLSGVLWRHYLHPEQKSLGPDGKHCDGWTRGLMGLRPVKAIISLSFMGKEVERRAQEGEDVSIVEALDQFVITRANEQKSVQQILPP